MTPANTVEVKVVDSGPVSVWQMITNLVVILGVFIAFGTYFWTRRQKVIEHTVAVAEQEIYDEDFQNAAGILEVAMHNPRFMHTSPFHLPREYRDALVLVLGHYKTVLARVDERLIDRKLYRKVMGFRLNRQRSLLDPYIQAIREEEDDPQWGSSVMDLLHYDGDATDDILARGGGWAKSQRYLIRNMSAKSIIDYLESRSAELTASSWKTSETARWYLQEWESSPRAIRLKWVKGRKAAIREEIVNHNLGKLSWADFSSALATLDEEVVPSIAALRANQANDEAPRDHGSIAKDELEFDF